MIENETAVHSEPTDLAISTYSL